MHLPEPFPTESADIGARTVNAPYWQKLKQQMNLKDLPPIDKIKFIIGGFVLYRPSKFCHLSIKEVL